MYQYAEANSPLFYIFFMNFVHFSNVKCGLLINFIIWVVYTFTQSLFVLEQTLILTRGGGHPSQRTFQVSKPLATKLTTTWQPTAWFKSRAPLCTCRQTIWMLNELARYLLLSCQHNNNCVGPYPALAACQVFAAWLLRICCVFIWLVQAAGSSTNLII